MSIHRMSLPEADQPQSGDLLWIEGEEAHHAVRVKRLGETSPVELLDGRGTRCLARIERIEKQAKTPASGRSRGRNGSGAPGGWRVGVRIERVETVEPLRPAVELCAAAPKGERFETMVSMVSQVGVASLRTLESRRSVSDPRPGKMDRMRRIAAESAKQCGRAWAMRVERSILLGKALEREEGVAMVLADGSGNAYEPTGSPAVRLLIGPEGGWTPRELEQGREAGAQVASFGAHVLRIETASVVASAAVLIAEGAVPSPHAAPEESAAQIGGSASEESR